MAGFEKDSVEPSAVVESTQQPSTSVAAESGGLFNEQTKYMPPGRIITVSPIPRPKCRDWGVPGCGVLNDR